MGGGKGAFVTGLFFSFIFFILRYRLASSLEFGISTIFNGSTLSRRCASDFGACGWGSDRRKKGPCMPDSFLASGVRWRWKDGGPTPGFDLSCSCVFHRVGGGLGHGCLDGAGCARGEMLSRRSGMAGSS